jgi:DNA-binding protein H-NS
MSSLKDLIAQREAIDKQIKEMQLLKRSEAISQAKVLISENGLTAQDLFEVATKSDKAVSKKLAMYCDPVSSKTWTGQGRTPKWITDTGKDKSDFLIAKEA